MAGVLENAKTFALCSLADVCFLQALIRSIRYIIVSVCVQIFKGCLKAFCIRLYVSCSSVFILPVCEGLLLTVSFLLLFTFSPLSANQVHYNIFCFDFLWCGESGHLSTLSRESSDSSKTNPRQA